MGESIMQNGKRESLIKRPLKSYSQLLFCCFLSDSWKRNAQSHMHKGWKNQRHFSLYSTWFTGPLHHSLNKQGISREVSLKTFSISPFVEKPLQGLCKWCEYEHTLMYGHKPVPFLRHTYPLTFFISWRTQKHDYQVFKSSTPQMSFFHLIINKKK